MDSTCDPASTALGPPRDSTPDPTSAQLGNHNFGLVSDPPEVSIVLVHQYDPTTLVVPTTQQPQLQTHT